MDVKPPEAWLSEDRQTVHMRRAGWSGDFPVSELGRWLQFYRGLRDRAQGKFTNVYGPSVVALERIDLELRSGS